MEASAATASSTSRAASRLDWSTGSTPDQAATTSTGATTIGANVSTSPGVNRPRRMVKNGTTPMITKLSVTSRKLDEFIPTVTQSADGHLGYIIGKPDLIMDGLQRDSVGIDQARHHGIDAGHSLVGVEQLVLLDQHPPRDSTSPGRRRPG